MEGDRYADLSRALHARAVAQRVPINGTIEVTRRCVLGCVHCYNNLPAADGEARRRELSCAEHRRIVDEIVEQGCLWLLYTGGEIFARPDFLEIYTYAKRKGLLVTLFTNGTLITEAIADHLAEWRPFSVEITLHGYSEETYERVTGVAGSHARCMRGIRLLVDRGVPLALKTTVMTVNRHEVAEMRRFAEDDLGVGYRFDAEINPRIDYSTAPLDVRLSPEEVVALDREHAGRVDAWQRFAAQFCSGGAPTADQRGLLYHCGAGITGFRIDPYGMLSTCTLSTLESYDLRQGSFRDGWENFLLGVRRKPATRPTKCSTCGIKAMCGMCPVSAELECRDPEEAVEFLCRVAHMRARTLGLEVPLHGDCEYCEGDRTKIR